MSFLDEVMDVLYICTMLIIYLSLMGLAVAAFLTPIFLIAGWLL